MTAANGEHESLALKVFTEKAYLDYSMAVILDRAVPRLADGQKPVQRRILYAMSELGLAAGAKPKKSARTVGDVLGKFHPHGDLACYEAMVLMAQPFSFRYPLIEGQGNWGSLDDPKSFAAMRYTEARLTPFAEVLLAELAQGTVDWAPNFDGTLEEPRLLPARVPVVLANGASGIAVGMATDIPPHNLRELVSATIALLDNPDLTDAKLARFIKAPDFPTGGEIVTPAAEIRSIYRTGTGSLKLRASWERVDDEVLITALPFQVPAGRVLEQIAREMRAKRLPMVEDLRDESDQEQPVRLVIRLRSNRVDAEAVMAHLFVTTELERNVRVNFNLIGLNGRPQIKSLKALLSEWLEFRMATVTRRLQWRLGKIEDRLHLVEGLLKALLDIDAVIRLVRREDEPKPALMKRFGLTQRQAEYVLETKLRQLARLEEIRLTAEHEALDGEAISLRRTLKDKRRLRSLVREELAADAEHYGDRRRTVVVEREAARAFSETELVPSEAAVVVLSRHGWIRSAKGYESNPEALAYRTGDAFLAATPTRMNHTVVFLDSSGRVYSLAVHTLPSARGHGEPLTGRVDPPAGARFVGLTGIEDASQALVVASSGHGFLAPTAALAARNRAGKQLLSVIPGAEALALLAVAGSADACVALATSAGYFLVIAASEIPRLARGKGVKLVGIPAKAYKEGERVVSVVVLTPGCGVRVEAGERHKNIDADSLRAFHRPRARRGLKLPRGFQKPSRLVAIAPR